MGQENEILRRLDEMRADVDSLADAKLDREEKGELTAKVAGQEVSLKNVSLNTIATVTTLVAVGVLLYVAVTHSQEAKDSGRAFVEAIKEQTKSQLEQTSVMREQTCIMRFDQKDRQTNADFCKQIAR